MGTRFSLEDRVAVITGGANGIGRQTALVFAQAGASVAVWDMVEEPGHALVEEVGSAKAAFFKTNVTSREEVEAAVEATLARFGKIDILINNAGITRDAQLVRVKDGQVIGTMGDAEFDAVIAVNLKGVFNCTRAVAPHMIARGYGRIVSASSVVGIYGNFGQTNYVATKSGVIGMTRVWARELGKRGITVNAVAPGFIGTDMVRGMPEHLLQEMVRHTPAGRMGQPEDVAYAYLFLASEEASFINGTVLSVDGGLVVGT
jgi:3-oxoacyl-[acyl-carrier protein] reductase